MQSGVITRISYVYDGDFGGVRTRILAPNGFSTMYCHMQDSSNFPWKTGDTIFAGEVVGKLGSTGRSSSVHLHLEVWKGDNFDNKVNPTTLYPQLSK